MWTYVDRWWAWSFLRDKKMVFKENIALEKSGQQIELRQSTNWLEEILDGEAIWVLQWIMQHEGNEDFVGLHVINLEGYGINVIEVGINSFSKEYYLGEVNIAEAMMIKE